MGVDAIDPHHGSSQPPANPMHYAMREKASGNKKEGDQGRDFSTTSLSSALLTGIVRERGGASVLRGSLNVCPTHCLIL
ncbi:hypothetical protein CEXT_440611 [Caerostris extrusa]|uniref:Uncharacterized protein n=1 Tax=Caerostris extrusa TaxID=172846 RepID=A0AAV4RHX7_CAEEX|nr:hypothetical protein CEXT_440611 [Caerostris extrusa]